jgi:hypothetical protein
MAERYLALVQPHLAAVPARCVGRETLLAVSGAGHQGYDLLLWVARTRPASRRGRGPALTTRPRAPAHD